MPPAKLFGPPKARLPYVAKIKKRRGPSRRPTRPPQAKRGPFD